MLIEVRVNCPEAAVARRIGEHLLERRLVAAFNIADPVGSAYRWKGRVETAREVPLAARTRARLFEAVVSEVRRLHPYEVPSVVGFEIAAAAGDYRAWILDETEGAGQGGGGLPA